MDIGSTIGIMAVLVIMIGGLGVGYYLLIPRQAAQYRSLLGREAKATGRRAARGVDGASPEELERLKAAGDKRFRKKQERSLEELFFRAGVFSADGRRDFQRLRVVAPIVCCILGAIGGALLSPFFALALGIFGIFGGMQLPFSVLERKAKARAEDIMFFLPLVVEQIAIGVSSSLDIGPCLQRIVQMSDERDTHNVVTELIKHVLQHIKSGVSLEDGLIEIGRLSGHTELKHTFMSLSQVAKHGGEISRQLQELADAVASQRETQIEEQIKKLELKATAPVALVFMGFMLILLIGFGLQVLKAFGG